MVRIQCTVIALVGRVPREQSTCIDGTRARMVNYLSAQWPDCVGNWR